MLNIKSVIKRIKKGKTTYQVMTLLMVGSCLASGITFVPNAYAATSAPPIDSNGIVEVSTAAQLEYIDANQSAYLNDTIEIMNNIDVSG